METESDWSEDPSESGEIAPEGKSDFASTGQVRFSVEKVSAGHRRHCPSDATGRRGAYRKRPCVCQSTNGVGAAPLLALPDVFRRALSDRPIGFSVGSARPFAWENEGRCLSFSFAFAFLFLLALSR